jgi:hypothetical protein
LCSWRAERAGPDAVACVLCAHLGCELGACGHGL